MSVRLAVMLADGAEPLEVVAPVDAWRRGGIEVTCVSIMDAKAVEAAQGMKLEADALLSDVDLMSFDALFVPGGSVGVENLLQCDALADSLRAFMAQGKHVLAICAGPMVLNAAGVLEGRRVTCYPGCETGFPTGSYVDDAGVIVDGNLITAAGPAYALSLGIAGLEAMTTQAEAKEVAEGMLVSK